MAKHRNRYKEENRKIRRMVLHANLHSEYVKLNTYEACWHRVHYGPEWRNEHRAFTRGAHRTRHRQRDIHEREPNWYV